MNQARRCRLLAHPAPPGRSPALEFGHFGSGFEWSRPASAPSNGHSGTDASFPLTPALSPREREHHLPLPRSLANHRLALARHRIQSARPHDSADARAPFP